MATTVLLEIPTPPVAWQLYAEQRMNATMLVEEVGVIKKKKRLEWRLSRRWKEEKEP
jgi:hypothetical protein